MSVFKNFHFVSDRLFLEASNLQQSWTKSSFEYGRQICKRSNSSRPCCPGVRNYTYPRQPGSCRGKTETAAFIENSREDRRSSNRNGYDSRVFGRFNCWKMIIFFEERRKWNTSVVLYVVVLCVSFASQGECLTTPRKLHIRITIRATIKKKLTYPASGRSISIGNSLFLLNKTF